MHGYVTGLNNLGAISYSTVYFGATPGPLAAYAKAVVSPAYVIKDNGTHNQLSESMLTPLEGSGFEGGYVEANALNDVGGVAGSWQYFFEKSSEDQVSFSGNADWLLGAGQYGVSFFDGYNDGANAFAINNLNVSAGIGSTTGTQQATIFSATKHRQTLLPLQHPICASDPSDTYAVDAAATGINDAGEVVGYEQSRTLSTNCQAQQAVRFSTNGYAQPIFAPSPSTNGFRQVAEAINGSGDIVGYVGGAQIKAYLYLARCGCVEYIPRPLGEHAGQAEAYSVNAHDDVVGSIIYPNTNTESAFYLTRGRTYDLNSLLPPNSGWTISIAIAINDAREIIGYGYYQDPVTNQSTMAAFAMKP